MDYVRVCDDMDALKLRYWPAYAAKNRLRILMYHSISDTAQDSLAVSPERFASEMKYLHDRRFEVITLQNACRRLETGRNLRRTIVLTFDDGYRDFLATAVPILVRYQFPATLFAVVGQGQSGLPFGPEPLLSEREVRKVCSLGFEIGSHTLTHAELTKLEPEALSRELSRSHEALAELAGEFLPLAYPGGKFSDEVCLAADRAGYSCAVIVGGRWGNGPETDRFRLRREPMLASDSLEWFKKRVNGYYEAHYFGARMRGYSTR